MDTWWQVQQDKETLVTAYIETLLSTNIIIIYNINI